MGPGVDKLFLEAAGQPIVFHTWKAFDRAGCIAEVVIVVRDGMQEHFEELAKLLHPTKPWRLAIGGKERQDSVWNGLQAIAKEAKCVAIHDGARPCVSEALIAATITAAQSSGAAVAAQRVTDTIKESTDQRIISAHLDRSRLWAVQTPQTFQVEVLRRALSAVRERGVTVTDDTAACEFIGQPVQLVESPGPNPKVTVPADLPVIELLLSK